MELTREAVQEVASAVVGIPTTADAQLFDSYEAAMQDLDTLQASVHNLKEQRQAAAVGKVALARTVGALEQQFRAIERMEAFTASLAMALEQTEQRLQTVQAAHRTRHPETVDKVFSLFSFGARKQAAAPPALEPWDAAGVSGPVATADLTGVRAADAACAAVNLQAALAVPSSSPAGSEPQGAGAPAAAAAGAGASGSADEQEEAEEKAAEAEAAAADDEDADQAAGREASGDAVPAEAAEEGVAEGASD